MLPGSLRICAVTLLGVVMAATPLALWVAWSQTVFILVLAVFAVAFVFFAILFGSDGSRDDDLGHGRRPPDSVEPLSDEFLSKLSNMGPWIYHNRLPGDPEFQRKIDTLNDRSH